MGNWRSSPARYCGPAYACALAAAGEDKLLRLIEEVMRVAMILSGARSVAGIAHDLLAERRAFGQIAILPARSVKPTRATRVQA
jgi:hypothetical protein